MSDLLFTLGDMVYVVGNALIMLIIIQFVIGLLFAFNVVNQSNDFLMAFYNSINRFLDPVLRPIRNKIPETGMIDFSPLVLIIGIKLLELVINGVGRSLA